MLWVLQNDTPLCCEFYPTQQFQIAALECLTEVAGIKDLPDPSKAKDYQQKLDPVMALTLISCFPLAVENR